MLKFKTSCAVFAYLSSNLLNEVGLSLFRYFEVGLRVCDIVVKKFTFAISSPDEFLFALFFGSRRARTSGPILTIYTSYEQFGRCTVTTRQISRLTACVSSSMKHQLKASSNRRNFAIYTEIGVMESNADARFFFYRNRLNTRLCACAVKT